MLKCQSMRNWVRSMLSVNIILFLLYMELSCCLEIKIDRELRDISDLLDASNCESIKKSHIERGRCRCGATASIASINKGPISCINNNELEKSKYT